MYNRNQSLVGTKVDPLSHLNPSLARTCQMEPISGGNQSLPETVGPLSLTYDHRSQWSIGPQRPPAIALCSELLLSFWTSWSPAVSALLQCLASNYCEAGLSSSSPVGSRSGLGVWCWMLASCGCVRSSPTSSAVSAWPLVPVPLAPTELHFGSSLTDRNLSLTGTYQVNPLLLEPIFSKNLSKRTNFWWEPIFNRNRGSSLSLIGTCL